MDNFNFCRPTDFYFGRGVENDTGKVCVKHGAKKVLIHYGGQSAVKSGLLTRVQESLDDAGVAYVCLGGVQPNPRAELFYEGIRICREQSVDLVLAVGGGSVIDSAKAIAMGVPYDGDFWDFFMGGRVPERALPVGCVLTIAAAGSEGSNSCVIDRVVDGVVKKKGSNFQTNVCTFSILNPELTYTLPPFQTACGACDIMCHVIERYFTNTRAVKMSDELCEGVLRTVVQMLPRVMADPRDYDARASIMWASTLAHNNLLGADREQDWASHHLEHELSAMYDCAHGAGLAVVTPAWMTYVYKHDVMRFARFAVNVMGCQMDYEDPEQTALAGIAALRQLWGNAGLPLNFDELGAKREDIDALVANIGGPDHKEGHFVVLNKEDVRRIYQLAADYQRPQA